MFGNLRSAEAVISLTRCWFPASWRELKTLILLFTASSCPRPQSAVSSAGPHLPPRVFQRQRGATNQSCYRQIGKFGTHNGLHLEAMFIPELREMKHKCVGMDRSGKNKAGSTWREPLTYTYNPQKSHVCTSCVCKRLRLVVLNGYYLQWKNTFSYQKEVKVVDQVKCCGKASHFSVLIE